MASLRPPWRDRSLALAELLPQLPAGCQYVSLQKEVRDVDRLALQAKPQLVDLGAELSDFSDTAAPIECLDLLISVDTSVAHLAAALGKEVWILLPFSPDWRWLLARDDSPWYPTAKLYRQERSGDWQTVAMKVAADLISKLKLP